MKNFFFGAEPQPLKIDALRVVVWFVVMLGVFKLLGWDTKSVWVVMAGLSAGLAAKRLWWHYWPAKAPRPHPVTRYTNPRYTKH